MVKDNEQPNEERTYDVIFIDLEMPIKNGFEACKMIRQHYENLQEEQELNSMEQQILKENGPQWLNDLNFVYKQCIMSLE
jgi:CheY-like chemotaxis protein